MSAPASGAPTIRRAAGTSQATARPSFFDVSAVANERYAWAVGSLSITGPAVLLGFDGRRWSKVPVNLPVNTSLSTVDATSKTTGWIAGEIGVPFSPVQRPFLALVSNARVHRVNLKAYGDGYIADVVVVSATDVWAVGGLESKSMASRPLALNWNGRSWRQVKVLSQQTGLALDTFAAVGPTHLWMIATNAAGVYEVLRWTGKEWAVSLTAPSDIGLSDIAASSSTDAWVVGAVDNGTAAGYVAQWNGSTWRIRHTSSAVVSLNGVVMVGGRTWIAGQDEVSPTSSRLVPVMLYSGGGKLRQEAAPDPGAGKTSNSQSRFIAISAASAKFLIAVGDNGTECSVGTGFADIYNGRSWVAAAFPPKESTADSAPDCGG